MACLTVALSEISYVLENSWHVAYPHGSYRYSSHEIFNRRNECFFHQTLHNASPSVPNCKGRVMWKKPIRITFLESQRGVLIRIQSSIYDQDVNQSFTFEYEFIQLHRKKRSLSDIRSIQQNHFRVASNSEQEGGQSSRVVLITKTWPAYHEFKPKCH
ncbi:hypothetical protein TNCV_3610981 [Trichonephila clavipes]|nr:hypothetical protein TNCV_3610981 [Trichonephila clavipes]